ncbi:MAG: response regulator [Candidatus Kapabacteria bacterium]|nr:response regulator [Candidatus Kapabacteria bacterium]
MKSIYKQPLALIDGFQRLVSGELSYRMERNFSQDDDDTIAFSFNTVAEELDRVFEELKTNQTRLNNAIDLISNVLMQVAAGNFDVEVERDYRGDPLDVLVYLVNTTISEIRLLVQEKEKEKRNIEVQTRLENIVEQKTTELREALDKAETANIAKSSFLATMSHEIRTPLNAVIGLTGLILNTEITSVQRTYLETIISSGDLLLNIINDILDFSKIESGRMELDNHPFDLFECVESVLDMVAKNATAKHLDIGVIYDDQVPRMIKGDLTRLKQVLNNLLSNGIKFTEKGQVKLSIKLEYIDSENSNKIKVKFEVSDTGIGISNEDMNKLFKSFSQVDASTTRKYGGSGLGLVISKHLVEMMGGEIWVESSGIGAGSIFNFTISAELIPELMLNIQDQYSDLLVNKNILIIDNNVSDLLILIKLLVTWKMNPVAISSPSVALDLIEKGEHFDFAIVDMYFPEFDGYKLSEEIRKRANFDKMPIFIVCNTLNTSSSKTKETIIINKPIKASILYSSLLEFATLTNEFESKKIEELNAKTEIITPLEILIVEDNLVNQNVAKQILVHLGYHPEIASNGFEAIEYIQRKKFDLIFMDLHMPHLDGIDATKQIRAKMNTQPYIIAMTANALRGTRERCIAAGMDDFVNKPVDIDGMISIINKVKHLKSNTKYLEISSEMNIIDYIDEREFQKLIRYDEPEKLIEIYLDESKVLIENIKTSFEHKNFFDICEYAHSLKGSSGYVGAKMMRKLCAEIEIASKNSDFDTLSDKNAQLDIVFDGTFNALTSKLKGK